MRNLTFSHGLHLLHSPQALATGVEIRARVAVHYKHIVLWTFIEDYVALLRVVSDINGESTYKFWEAPILKWVENVLRFFIKHLTENELWRKTFYNVNIFKFIRKTLTSYRKYFIFPRKTLTEKELWRKMLVLRHKHFLHFFVKFWNVAENVLRFFV